MTYGPIDFLALEFKGNQFKGEIFPIVVDLVNQGIVRIIDILVVQKAPDGKVTSRQIQEHDKAVLELFDPTRSEITGMIQVEDIEIIGEKLEPNTTAALLLFENLWAVRHTEPQSRIHFATEIADFERRIFNTLCAPYPTRMSETIRLWNT